MAATTADGTGGDGAEIAYDAIAPVYDAFTDRTDYERWLGNLIATIEPFGLRGKRLLDVGCGTGKSFIPMLAKGWEVSGCDISAAMVELARAKVGDGAQLAVADMRELPRFGEFDLVWCLDDAVNYLLGVGELEAALAGMGANLAPEGLLVFDVNTIASYRGFFAEEIVVERDGRRLIWRGLGSPDQEPGTTAEASFEAEPLLAGAGPSIAPEIHRERHFTEAEVLAALGGAGVECLGVYGFGADAVLVQPPDEIHHEKVVYVGRPAS